MNENGISKPALIAGVLLGLLSAIPPFNCACCAWAIGGGILAAHLYVRSSPNVVTLGTGVGLGLLTGAIGALVSTFFGVPIELLMRKLLAPYTEQARQMISQWSNLPTWIREMIDASANAEITLPSVIGAAVFNLLIYSPLAMIGGVLGVALFEKRKATGPQPSYRPPAGPSPPSQPQP